MIGQQCQINPLTTARQWCRLVCMNILRQLREDTPLTLDELAEASGVGKWTIWRLEQGHVGRPYPSTLRKLAVALGVDVSVLVPLGHRHE